MPIMMVVIFGYLAIGGHCRMLSMMVQQTIMRQRAGALVVMMGRSGARLHSDQAEQNQQRRKNSHELSLMTTDYPITMRLFGLKNFAQRMSGFRN